MSVLLDEICAEGLVHIRDMAGDYYCYDEKNYRLVGKRTKEIFGFDKRNVDLRLVMRNLDALPP